MSLIDDLSLFIIDATDAREEKTILFPLPTILFQLWQKKIWTLQESVTTISGSICLLVTSGHHEKKRKVETDIG